MNVVRAFEEVGGASVLAQIQDDIRGLRPLPEILAESRLVAPNDRSMRFHVAHSALREVEILHDQLLAAFDADHSLEPDDVIVMVPDIEKYVPHIEAVFGLYGPDDKRHLPYFIVDRGASRANTVVDAVRQLLSLPVTRMTLGQVLDLLDIAAVRKRFDLDEDGIAVLRQWVDGAKVRWGLDPRHRETLGLPMHAALADLHTWKFGLQRMLLGYATGDVDSWNDIAPFGDVSGLNASLVGSLAEIVDRLVRYADMFTKPATPREWSERLGTLLDDFLSAPDDVAGYTIEQLTLALDTWLEQCELSGFEEALPLEVVSRHWLGALEQAGMAQRFASGAITFATLMPMRAIPFRHVCLLGMNDEDYPRPRSRLGFDLMEKDYRPGDRSRRDDDRYLFLEALLSARECFYISWVGRSIVDNTERPPSVLVGQLRDHIAVAWSAAQPGGDVLQQLTACHPLQAFSLQYFLDASQDAGLFTYSREWRDALNAADTAEPAGRARLDALSRDEPLMVGELKRFLEHPVREFFRKRLEIRMEEEDAVAEEESFLPGGLEKWGVYDALIRAAQPQLLAGEDPMPACDAAMKRMERAGELALGVAARHQIHEGVETVRPLFEEFQSMLAEWPEPVPEIHQLTHRNTKTPALTGWLGGFRARESGSLLRVEMIGSRLVEDKEWREGKLLGYWLEHLLGNASGLDLTTCVLSPAGHARFKPVEEELARGWLDAALSAWAEGMCRPLPVKVEFAHPVLKGLAGHDLSADTDWEALLQNEELMKALRNFHAENWGGSGWDREVAFFEEWAYPDFESLMARGELLKWVARLYGPLFRAVRNTETA